MSRVEHLDFTYTPFYNEVYLTSEYVNQSCEDEYVGDESSRTQFCDIANEGKRKEDDEL